MWLRSSARGRRNRQPRVYKRAKAPLTRGGALRRAAAGGCSGVEGRTSAEARPLDRATSFGAVAAVEAALFFGAVAAGVVNRRRSQRQQLPARAGAPGAALAPKSSRPAVASRGGQASPQRLHRVRCGHVRRRRPAAPVSRPGGGGKLALQPLTWHSFPNRLSLPRALVLWRALGRGRLRSRCRTRLRVLQAPFVAGWLT